MDFSLNLRSRPRKFSDAYLLLSLLGTLDNMTEPTPKKSMSSGQAGFLIFIGGGFTLTALASFASAGSNRSDGVFFDDLKDWLE